MNDSFKNNKFNESYYDELNYEKFTKNDKPSIYTKKTQKQIASSLPNPQSDTEVLDKIPIKTDFNEAYLGKHSISAKKNRLSNKTKIIIFIILFFLVLFAIVSAIAFAVMNKSLEDEPNIAAKQQLTTTTFDEPFYMVIVGTDTREDSSGYSLEDGRSDTCMLARIDPINNLVTLISIPRDTKITLNGSTAKFNAAYSSGGIASTIEQVKKLCGVDISHYAEISFNGLKDVVDAVGGVEINVTEEIDDPHTDAYVGTGLQNLNGEQALSYARSRQFADGDFTRTYHQRNLIKAVVDKGFKMSLTELPNIFKIAKKFIKTDLSLSDLLGLATQFKDKDKVTIYSAMVPSFTQNIDGESYVVTDTETLERMMKMVDAGEDPAMVEVVSGASIGSNYNKEEMEAKQKQYYIDHPNSPGKATEKSYNTSSSSYYQNSYNNNYYEYDYDYSYNNNSNYDDYSYNNYNGNY